MCEFNKQELAHHGVKGMKWGVRKAKYQQYKALKREYGNLEDQYTYGKNYNKKKNAALDKRMKSIESEMNTLQKELKPSTRKKVFNIVAGVALFSVASATVKRISTKVEARSCVNDYLKRFGNNLIDYTGMVRD